MKSDLKALADVYSRIITESNGRRIITSNVSLRGLYLKELPEWLAGVEIGGRFDCSNNLLTSLENSPISNWFHCGSNRLTTLKGAPSSCIEFYCGNNRLHTLEFGPSKVTESYYCNDNLLTDLVGAPTDFGTTDTVQSGLYVEFTCSNNYLTTLRGGPQGTVGIYNCSFNNLRTLEFAPRVVDESFDCSDNRLTTLVGGPEEVQGEFDCSYNELTSLEGVPRDIHIIYCNDNKVKFTQEYIQKMVPSVDIYYLGSQFDEA